MKYVKMFTILIAAAMLMMVAGCGSSKDSSGSISGDSGDVIAAAETLGVNNCANCHSAATPETLSWLFSTHGNSNGSMRYDDPRGPHGEGSSCQPCHNQLLDGDKLDTAFPSNLEIGTWDSNDNDIIEPGIDDPVFAGGSRDIVTCESCHGGGQFHGGVGPIPFPRPDWEQCVSCHDHEGKRHDDDFGNLASNVGASAHNNSDDLHASTTRCQRCHTAEGSVELAQFTGDSDAMHAADDTDPIDLEENLHAVTCAACHVPHNDSGRWEQFITLDYGIDKNGDDDTDDPGETYTGDWDPNGNGSPDQFDFCTSCHTYYNQDGTLIGSGSTASGTAPHYHNTAWYRVIPTTHYDNPATGYGLATSAVEGYVIREDSASPCFDCHGHELRTNTRRHTEDPALGADYGPTRHTDWANSRHGGNLLEAKVAAAEANPITLNRGDAGYEAQGQAQVDAVMAAGRFDGVGLGWSWTHYNWDQSTGTGNRAGCQRCHTATGVSNFLTDPTTYDPLNNDFSHLDSWTAGTGSTQNEMLYCWGCHESAQTGVLRNPGAITETYDPAVIVAYPDINESNVCMACHLGRETGGVIKVDADVDGIRSFINSHYLAAGAAIFTESGYEYVGRDYANVSFYAHDQIGMGTDTDLAAWEAENGTPGPCVGCHMSSDQDHSFTNVEKDGTGDITAITTDICASCHNGQFALTPAILNDEEHEYEASLDTLAGALTLVGIYYDPAVYSYFFSDPVDRSSAARFTDWESIYPGLPGTDVNWKNTMGACFNLNLAGHDPGGFAHNRFYYKRLIWDSIDWIDDGVMNNSVPATIDALETATTIDAATASATRTYLGTSRPGDPTP